MIREEALKGAGIHSFGTSSPAGLTGKFSMFYFPEATTINDIYDQTGHSCLNQVTGGETSIPANTTIAGSDLDPDWPKYFTLINGTAGSVNYVNA